jgi:uncharacterized cupin superfamily protein
MSMSKIKVEKNPGQERLKEPGVSNWAIWTKKPFEFAWTYDETETCYFLKGDV